MRFALGFRRGIVPREKIVEWFNLVRLGECFYHILSNFFLITIFFVKNYNSYTIVMGTEIFENMLQVQLMRFSV